ncbi:MAG: hypothetical protein E6371_07595 [Terrisporobacter othiniensis]|uniref:hypothetical protein n=1 Tax=Terrisporobacter othiniensis TaxID=1577792 RepID=UPI0029107C00|nr:hypothetical protein [Terrisporobacter othiniensis]MDU6984264.1 hypothetical protein [Terrisporobacter othiniensis]
MNIRSYEDYEMIKNRIEDVDKENKLMALKIINLMAAQDMTSCNAKIVLSLCHDIIDINSKFVSIK